MPVVRLSVIYSLLLMGVAGATGLSVVPMPKEMKVAGPAGRVGSAAIVVGTKASEPEKYAADTLAATVKKWFGITWPVKTEGDDLQAFDTVVILGQRETNATVERLAQEWKLDLTEKAPGLDAYSIRMKSDGARLSVLVAGSNPRGVIYGQDTLSQLLSVEKGKLTVENTSIDDRASIPWRGKPQTSIGIHSAPPIQDWYCLSRINFTDLRNGIYAFEPEDKLDEAAIGSAIKELHRHGLIVYGTVNCGVERARHEAVLAMFERLIALGVDGLWVSFDDQGAGEAPNELMARVVELGREHGITGHLIAVTPPKGAYQMIVSDTTKKMLAVPGIDEALWFFTCIPSQANFDASRAIGLKSKPAWWHNWPRTPGRSMIGESGKSIGFLSCGISRAEGKPPYLPTPTLEEGWHQPTYEVLSGGGAWTDAVMQWGGSAWKWEYTYPTLGWWAWDPAAHDWQAARRRIYGLVYGPGLIDAAMQFDDSLRELRKLFDFPLPVSDTDPKLPPRLKHLSDRPAAGKLVASMESALARLKTVRTEDSFTTEEHLNKQFLDAQRAEVEAAKAAVELSYPEYWWDEHQRAVLRTIHARDTAKADALIGSVKDRVISEAQDVKKRLAEAGKLDTYVDYWTKMANLDARGWADMLKRRKEDFAKQVADLEYFRTGKFGKYLKGIDSPPKEFPVLSTAMPSEREYFRGSWLSGRHTWEGREIFLMLWPNKVYTNAGCYDEVEITAPVAGQKGWRGAQFYINAFVGESLGFETIRGRWLGRRHIQLLDGDRVLWQEDVSLLPGDGRWVTAGLPDEVEDMHTVTLRLRVEDLVEADNYPAMIFLSPFRIVTVPR